MRGLKPCDSAAGLTSIERNFEFQKFDQGGKKKMTHNNPHDSLFYVFIHSATLLLLLLWCKTVLNIFPKVCCMLHCQLLREEVKWRLEPHDLQFL